MSVVKVETKKVDRWEVEWRSGTCCVRKNGAGWCVCYHESTWLPDQVKEECRKVTEANRELAENEYRRSDGDIWTVEIDGDAAVLVSGAARLRYSREELGTVGGCIGRFALAYLDKHSPKLKSLTNEELRVICCRRKESMGASLRAVVNADRKREAEIREQESRSQAKENGPRVFTSTESFRYAYVSIPYLKIDC